MLLCSSCNADAAANANEPLYRTDAVMGTIAQMTFYGKEQGDAKAQQECMDGLMELVRTLEQETLSGKIPDSEVGLINAAQGAGAASGMVISEALEEVLNTCKKISKDSDGAFDVTIGTLCKLWNMDEVAQGRAAAVIPSESEVQEALAHSGYQNMTLRDHKIYLENGALLDLGSVGKGYALDKIAEQLSLRNGDALYQGGVVALGGSILTFGSKPDKSAWRVGIKDPLSQGHTIGYLELEGEWFISTSGDYERYFELEGKRFCHILDPNTGYPVDNGLRSVTVLAKNGLQSDALSTACFALGAKDAKKLAEEYGVMLLMVNEQGEIWLSEEMEKYFVERR